MKVVDESIGTEMSVKIVTVIEDILSAEV